MKIKIEDVWFKVVDKKDYPAYLAQCKQLNHPVKMKMQDGKVLYKVVDEKEIAELEKPVIEETVKEVKPFSFLSAKLLTADGKALSIVKPEAVVVKREYRKVPFIVGVSNCYGYCDTCATETNHYVVMDVLACGKCRNGVVLTSLPYNTKS